MRSNRRLPVLVLAVSPFTAQAQESAPPSPPAPVQAAALSEAHRHLDEGQRLMAEDAFVEASKEFEAAIAQNPELFMAHYGLGRARMATKEFGEAVTAFEAARAAFTAGVERNRRDLVETQQARDARVTSLRNTLRNSGPGGKSGAEERWLEAEVRKFELAMRKSEQAEIPPGLLLSLGSAYFRTGRLADAEREYRAALEEQPKLGEARSNLAVILLMTGRAREAQEQVTLAKKNGFKVPPGLVADIDRATAEGPKAP